MSKKAVEAHEQFNCSLEMMTALWRTSHKGMCCLQWCQDTFHIIDVNPTVLNWLSLPRSQVVDRPVADMFSFDAQIHQYQKALNTRQTVVFESVLTLGSRLGWYAIEVIPVDLNNNELPQLIVTFSDVSGYKQKELQLTQSVEMFQQILDAIPSALLWKDCHGVLQGCNRHFASIAGASNPKELIGKTAAEMPSQFKEIRHHLNCDRIITATGTPTLNVIQQTDDQVWLNTNRLPFHTANGEIKGTLVIFDDVTDRWSTELALRQSEERFRSLFEETSMIGMQIYDRYGRVIGWNHTSEELYGYTCEEAMGKKIEDLIIPDTMRDHVRQALKDWLERGIPIPASELTLQNKQGGPVEVFSSHVMLTNFKGDPELYCLDLDISDRKQAETTLQQARIKMIHGEKMSSLGKMVAGIAHEINNPISFIDGNLEHAKDYLQVLLHLLALYQQAYPNPSATIQTALQAIDLDFIQEDFSKLAASMQAGTDRIRNIVDSLRNFSRLDETGAKVIDIHEGLNSTLIILQHRLETTVPPIKIAKRYGQIPPILCYPGPLNQVFMNILTNAIDALMEPSTSHRIATPCIEISTAQINNQVTVMIHDNGPGISDTVKAHIFDPFFTTKPVGKGTGMGLAISYQIITQQHQGQLLVDSAVDRGTCFEIRLPIMEKTCETEAK